MAFMCAYHVVRNENNIVYTLSRSCHIDVMNRIGNNNKKSDRNFGIYRIFYSVCFVFRLRA